MLIIHMFVLYIEKQEHRALFSMFPMILHYHLNHLHFRELAKIMLPSSVRICLGSLTWNAYLHVFSQAGNLVYYIILYICRDLMQYIGSLHLLVSVNCFLVFNIRILSCFCTFGSLNFFGSLSNLNDSSTQATFFCSDENQKSSNLDASEKSSV